MQEEKQIIAACGNRPWSAWLHVYVAYTFFLSGLSLLLGVSLPANWLEDSCWLRECRLSQFFLTLRTEDGLHLPLD